MKDAAARRKILILSSSTGSGHDQRARAISEWIERDFAAQAEVKVEQIIENGSRIGAFGVWFYNQIQQRAPALHHIYWPIVEWIMRAPRNRVELGRAYYRRLIEDYQPDLILSLHDSTNRGYFEDARSILGKGKVTCVTYCGEWSGGYGFSANWINFTSDLLVARTEDSRAFIEQQGFPRDRLAVFQNLLPPAAFEERERVVDREEARRNLGLEPSRLTLFLATGGYGANHHEKFLKALSGLENEIQLIIVCGRNEKVHRRLERWKKAHPHWKIALEAFSHRMPLYYRVSDFVVTRGGANSTAEALHFECPPFYDLIGSAMPQEMCTIRYLEGHGLTKRLEQAADLKRETRNLLNNPGHLDLIRSNLRQLHAPGHPREWLAGLLSRPPARIRDHAG